MSQLVFSPIFILKYIKENKLLNLIIVSFLLLNFQKCTSGSSSTTAKIDNLQANNITRSITRPTTNQVVLNPSMMYSNCGCFGASAISNLVDEQLQQIPRSEFTLPSDPRYNKAQFIIDLKAKYKINQLSAFELAGNWRGKDTVFIYTGNPTNWRAKGYINTLRNADQWSSIDINDTTQFVMLAFNLKIKDIEEIVLFGSKLTSTIPTPTIPIQTLTPPTMDKLMGATGGLWENEKLLTCISSLREFHSWNWNDGGNDLNNNGHTLPNYPSYPKNYYNFNPDYSNRHTDDDYKRLTNAGIELNPCLQTSAYYFINGDNENNKPVANGHDPNNPKSYMAHADYLYQFAARYGHNTVPSSLLKLDTKPNGPQHEMQPIISGLGVVKTIENWNEPDKWWHPSAATFTPFQFAAMCSADYDAHEGTLGKTVGIKNADPNMKLVMGGLATLNIEYIKGMKLWADHNRSKTKTFPADVLNFHHYCNAFENNGQPSIGISPEDDHLKEKLKEIVKYRNQNLPNLQIWLSEFGYDTQEGSTQAAPSIGSNNSFEIQGRWLMRSFLEIAASGIDRAFVYNFDDYGFNTTVQYLTSGIVKGAPGNEKKTAWYYIACLKKILKGYTFSQEIKTSQAGVNIYAFKSSINNNTIYAIWCNTSNNKEIYNFYLPAKGKSIAKLYNPQANNALFTTSNLIQNANSFTIPIVSELPVFIQIEQ